MVGAGAGAQHPASTVASVNECMVSRERDFSGRRLVFVSGDEVHSIVCIGSERQRRR